MATTTYLVDVPANAVPGHQMAVAVAGGLTVMVTLPPGVMGGERIEVAVPVSSAIHAVQPQHQWQQQQQQQQHPTLPRPQQHHQYQQHGATATNDVIVAPDADNTLRACTCDERCCKGFLWVGGSYCSAITAAALFTIVLALVGLAALGLVIMAFAPAAVVLYWAWKWYGRYLTRCTIADVMLEATAILLVPLIVAISFIDYYLPMTTMCGASNPNAPVYRYFFQAFVRAALLEELLKYFAIRRLLFKEYIVDPRALLVYGTVSGLTFGVLENITYALVGGIGTAIARSFLTVPLHSMFGFMIGASLVKYRFGPGHAASARRVAPDAALELAAAGAGAGAGVARGAGAAAGAAGAGTGGQVGSGSGAAFRSGAKKVPCGWGCLKEHLTMIGPAVGLPVFIHGTYDVFLFVATGECGLFFLLYLPVIPLIAFTIVYVRRRTFEIEAAYPPRKNVDVHALVRDGHIQRPCSCCRCCACCY